MKNKILQKMLALVLVLCMVAAWAMPAGAATVNGRLTQVSSDRISADLFGKDAVDFPDSEPAYADTDIVRVSIVVDGAGALDAGYSPVDIAENANAMKYRANLKAKQDALSGKISKAIGQELDVVWNLTLAANIISANVPYGMVDSIKAVKGVDNVVLETVYQVDVVEKGGDNPNMATSSMQIGSTTAYAAGLTGAGSRIAIIDTGLDVEHISFDPNAFMYSLLLQAQRADMDLNTYLEKLDLLDAAEVAELLPNLNMSAMMGEGITADDLFVNDKVPFGFNYVDANTSVTHLDDTQGEHGSHVAGIAAANAYIPSADGGFDTALDTVLVQGVAPDAQLMVMKVFGANGGAYDSDYMVALEDAVMLGADAINLSLGSAYPGAATAGYAYYQTIMEKLEKSGVVVSISAGNSGSFADYTPYGVMYLDDPMVSTVGSPGSFTNSLAVASADNIGYSGEYMYANGGWLTPFTESDGYSNAPIGTVAGKYEYVYAFGIGTPDQFDAMLDALDLESFEGKVVLCDRGEIDFSAKANAAAERGAAAVIIVNTENVGINMVLSDYKYQVPVVSIMAFYGQLFSDEQYGATVVTDADGKAVGAVGTVEINEGPVAGLLGGWENSEMSTFSSWGVPGDLSMKPEITAPGGSIYSVAGAINTGNGYFFDDHASYEVMSGTSMASPQVAGMAAVMAQYIREYGLEERTGLDARTLAQSLLMSTAVPMFDGNYGSYYPILQQGSGLANLGNALLADSYILMDADATDSYADGKVKVELGDDPDRVGEYTFSFYIHNLTDTPEVYTLSADFFTQAAADAGLEDFVMHYITSGMEQSTTWTVDGVASEGTATVPANGSVKVTATVKLSEDEKAFLDAYYTGGAWIEGFVYATGETTAEGEEGTAHSIPVLGYYGSWTDASMYDNGSFMEYEYNMESQIPYLYDVNWSQGQFNSLFYSPSMDPNGMYYFGGNPMIPDETYMPERDAINSAYPITTVGFTAIRGGAAGFTYVMNTETGATMLQQFAGAHSDYPSMIIPAFFNGETWSLNYTLEDVLFDFSAFEENDHIEVGTIIVPEYYVSEDGQIDFAALDDGAFFSMGMTIDNTAPVAENYTIDGDTMTVTVTDNQYVSAVVLLDITGAEMLSAVGADPNATAGATGDFVMDITDVNTAGFLIAVYDYAGNVSVYQMDEAIGETTEIIDSITVNPESMILNTGAYAMVTATVAPMNAIDRTYTWSSSDESVAMVTEDGIVIGVSAGTATITATANGDSTKTDTCEVTVVDIHKTLNAIVWDEQGSIYFSEFSTDSMPEYTKLSPDMLEKDYFVSAAVGPNDILYASSLDTSTGEGSIYMIDPKTFEPTYLTDCVVQGLKIFYSDLTYAPEMFGIPYGMLLGSYGPYVIAINPANGAAIGIIDQLDENKSIVGIAAGDSYSANGMYFNDVYIIENDGTVTCETYISYIDEDGYLAIAPYSAVAEMPRTTFSTGIDKGDAWYFNSAYYDGEYLYWSAFDQDTDTAVTLYAIDLEKGMTVNLGTFADSVWPVGGLFEMPCLHENTELKNVVTADCVTPGYTGDLYCSDCGALLQEGTATEIDPDNHDMGEWTETKAPTCTEPGEETCKCAKCDHTETREIPATGIHEMGEWTESKAPTCTEPGEETRKCAKCDHTETREIPATGIHEMGEWTETKAPTCAEPGEETRKCAKCDHTETREVAATGHSYKDVVTPPTEDAYGYTTHTCEACGHSYVDSYTEKLPNSQTGDSFDAALLTGLLLTSVAGLVILVTFRKKFSN